MFHPLGVRGSAVLWGCLSLLPFFFQSFCQTSIWDHHRSSHIVYVLCVGWKHLWEFSLIVFHPCSKWSIRFLNWIDPPTTKCLRWRGPMSMVLVPSHGVFPRFDASMIAAPSRRWLQVGQQQTTHHRFDAARGYFRRRISWEWWHGASWYILYRSL